jgi:hypothetical protein
MSDVSSELERGQENVQFQDTEIVLELLNFTSRNSLPTSLSHGCASQTMNDKSKKRNSTAFQIVTFRNSIWSQ